jgi:hypothetical protein
MTYLLASRDFLLFWSTGPQYGYGNESTKVRACVRVRVRAQTADTTECRCTCVLYQSGHDHEFYFKMPQNFMNYCDMILRPIFVKFTIVD